MRSTLKPAICFLKPPSRSDHLRRHAHVVEVELGPLLAGHELRGLAAPHALRLRLHKDRTDATDAGTEAHIREDHFGVRRCGEDLGAVDKPAVAVRRRARLEIGHGGAGVRLGHADRDHRLAAWRQRLRAISAGRTVFRQHADRAEVPAWTSALRGQTEATLSIAITASINVPPCPPSASGS